jgi:predicted O-linked N-acetylglucosamine transferase (SPINDLY family)
MPMPTANLIDTTRESEIQSIAFYEAAIEADEIIVSNYWYLGVAYILEGREDEAQATWFTPLANASPTEIEELTTELLTVLERTANYQAEISHLEEAWLLRQHFWNLAPENLANVLNLIILAQAIDKLTPEYLEELQVLELLQRAEVGSIADSILDEAMSSVLAIRNDLSLEIIELCLNLADPERDLLLRKNLSRAFELFYRHNAGLFAVKLGEICERINPNHLEVCKVVTSLYSDLEHHEQGIAAAQRYYDLAPGIVEKLFGSYLLQRANFTTGNWHGATERINDYRRILSEVIQTSPIDLTYSQRQSLLVSSFFLPYTEDKPQVNKQLQNQATAIFQNNTPSLSSDAEFEKPSLEKKQGILRIGYVGSTFRIHSVGWLNRWLIHHHDRENFQIFLYCVNQSQDDNFNHEWFRRKVHVCSFFDNNAQKIAAQIRADEIDILIDVDSLTFDTTCFVMAHKPAPVQATWLGWDSTGIPAIDYFIADPYVLPDKAQDYYQEKIWRLPSTYLAVDGFEVGTPTLRREDLDIPADAVVYLCSQSGYKRHPENMRLQMRILKEVPNSYFLIKGKSDKTIIQEFFGKIAAEEGVSLDRLRFLERDRDEYTHRANLAIADVVLDTFPYNGATTTLETLWMGIPLVTKVGQQFAARNSYTFMMNAGITEGIAWTDEEYVEWGIKLGTQPELRYLIQGKLKTSRNHAPVWNAKQFTREMEEAYRQMWAIYQQSLN